MRPASVIIVLVLLSAVTVGAWIARPAGPRAAQATVSADPTPRLPWVEPAPNPPAIPDVETLPDPPSTPLPPHPPEIQAQADPLVMPPNTPVFELDATPAEFLGLGLLTDHELRLLAHHGVVRIVGHVTRDAAGMTLAVWRFTTQGDPRPALTGIDRFYEGGRHSLEPTRHTGLLMRRKDDVFHGHYVRGYDVLRVEGYGPGSTAAITELTERQLTLSPAEEG